MDLDLEDSTTRAVFHGALLEHLREHGASSLSEMRARQLGVFWLPFEFDELHAIVSSAHKHGLVQPLWPPLCTDERTGTELPWLSTERGRKVEPQRSLSPVDLGYAVAKSALPLRAALGTLSSIVFFVLAPILSRDELLGDGGLLGNQAIFASGVIGLFAFAVIVWGTFGEYRLRTVAKKWKRFRCHKDEGLSEIKAWYLEWRAWPLLGPAIALLLAAGVLVLMNGHTAFSLVGFAILVGILVGILVLAVPRWLRFTSQIKQRLKERQ